MSRSTVVLAAAGTIAAAAAFSLLIFDALWGLPR